jgi:hypothetical protein
MTVVLGKFDILDPSFELKRVSADLGGSPLVFDKWSDLDPALAAKRINALHSGTITQVELLDPQRWVTKVNAIL